MTQHTLIGMYDSPFVRRVAISMQFYRLPYEHQPWSVFANSEMVRRHNPLGRVPVLLLDAEEALVESAAIMDYLDELAGPERALLPPSGPARRHMLRLVSTTMGACEKAVAIVYETQKRSPGTQDPVWIERIEAQLEAALSWLDERIQPLDHRPNQAQICAAVTVRFLQGYLPELAMRLSLDNLGRLSAACEGLPEFQAAPFVK